MSPTTPLLSSGGGFLSVPRITSRSGEGAFSNLGPALWNRNGLPEICHSCVHIQKQTDYFSIFSSLCLVTLCGSTSFHLVTIPFSSTLIIFICIGSLFLQAL